ncbi:hypothetical protein MHYP_G00291270 [Metynnis hypsauchen]
MCPGRKIHVGCQHVILPKDLSPNPPYLLRKDEHFFCPETIALVCNLAPPAESQQSRSAQSQRVRSSAGVVWVSAHTHSELISCEALTEHRQLL